MISGYNAIPNLLARYAEHVDLGDFAGVGELFANGVITGQSSGSTYTGVEQVRGMFEQWTRRYPDGTPRTKHLVTNLVLDVDDDAAPRTSRSYITVLQQTDTLPLQPIFAGRDHDRFERIEGTWRFAHREIIGDYTGDISQHLLQSL